MDAVETETTNFRQPRSDREGTEEVMQGRKAEGVCANRPVVGVVVVVVVVWLLLLLL